MQDFEKLGAFYLGRRVDASSGKTEEDLVLYDSADLTTHAVIIGMTGSGKTGLGIGLIEEAALDHVPVIAIDPKGDLGNLLLSFPELRPEDFEPWVDARAASAAGQTREAFAATTAGTWKKGLAAWGQEPERIRRLHKAADFNIYTPGSSAGRQLAVLGEFAPLPAALREDADLVNERIASTVNGLLALLGIDGDPVTSPEHILLSRILQAHWADGRTLRLPELIAAIQEPGIDKLGVMDLETFYPAKRRFELAMRLNGLLAAPGFEAWLEGDSLDPAGLLYNAAGKPRVSVISIAHLNDAQRMFFVTLLLGEIIAWMRLQPGSSTLRAILYMDEIFGYLPPVSNPPAKALFLTLLKQARAYGLGLVLSTQNPVDLDYKALSNAGTWFIGRLQTDRDKARVRDGLETAASGGLSGQELDQTLSSLGKRRFLLHNVHEKTPVVFETRWVMSYLAGPLTRDQIKRMSTAAEPAESSQAESLKPSPSESSLSSASSVPAPDDVGGHQEAGLSGAPPVLAPGIRQCFFSGGARPSVYRPVLLAGTRVYYANARLGIDQRLDRVFALEFSAGDIAADWDLADEIKLDLRELESRPDATARFQPLPAGLANEKSLDAMERGFKRWLRADQPLIILKSASLKLNSEPGETEAEFRIRLQHAANEARDIQLAKLRARYETKVDRLEARLLRARQALERESEQARGAQLDTALSIGTAVLGALLGRKRVSVTNASRAGSAARKASGARRQAGDVKRAKEAIAALEEKLQELSAAFDGDVEGLEASFDAQDDDLSEVPVRPRSTDIEIKFFGVGWLPAAMT